MSIQLRHYRPASDYRRVDAFLVEHYLPGNADGNWIRPQWEYMNFHPALQTEHLDRIGIWEDGGRIVGAATYESTLGDAFLQVDPAYRHLLPAMLDYAEEYLSITTDDGLKYLRVYVNDFDEELTALVRACGYEKSSEDTRPMSQLDIPKPFPQIRLPEGFRLTSLAEDCDWAKVHRVLWRGFDHAGEPPAGDEELESRRIMFDTPTASRALKIAVAAPNGDFVAFCGMFYEPAHRYAYVEPVATDPDYRRMGLGKAAVLEGVRRCAELGAAVAYVGSDQLFYQAIGFRTIFAAEGWIKRWPAG